MAETKNWDFKSIYRRRKYGGYHIRLCQRTIQISSLFAMYSNDEFMELRYSKKNNSIIFKFSAKEDADTIKINKITGILPSRGFFRKFNIDSNNYPHRIKLKLVNISNLGEVWVAHLKEGEEKEAKK